MADNSFDYTTGQWGAGDGYALDDSYGGYQVPLFNSGAYNNNQSNLLDPWNSVGYTSASDQLGLVPNYSSPNYGASAYESGGAGALGTLGSGLGSVAGGSTLGAVGAGASTLINAYEGASTNTGASVLSGAASGAVTGAEIGSVVPVIGTAFGAVAGAIIGGIAGFFGSKSKKNQEKKAFQQAEQQAVLPYQQQQANYLQNQGLLQQAIGNYRSAFTPGGYQYTNALTGGPKNTTYGIPTQAPNLPNFNQAPPNVVPGSGDKSLGIAPNNVPNNGVNLTPGPITQPAASSNPYYGFTAPTPLGLPTAPSYTGNKTDDQNSISNYQKQYQQYIQDQRNQMAAQSMNAYQPYFQGA